MFGNAGVVTLLTLFCSGFTGAVSSLKFIPLADDDDGGGVVVAAGVLVVTGTAVVDVVVPLGTIA